VGRAVVGDDPGPVEGENDGQVLQADIVVDLIIGPLEEGRIDGADGLVAVEGQAGGEIHGMLFGDPHIVKLGGQGLGEAGQARPLEHGRGDGQDLMIRPADFQHGLAEDLGIGRPAGFGRGFARFDVERGGAVEMGRVVLGREIAPAFAGDAVDEIGPSVYFLATSKTSMSEPRLWPGRARYSAGRALRKPGRGKRLS